MSKRKNRKSSSPKVKSEALERAPQQPAVDEPVLADEPAEAAAPAAKAAPARPADNPVLMVAPAPATRIRSTNRRRVEPAQARAKRKEQPDGEVIKNRLLHPTRVVTEAQLREEYGYVMKDLRTVAIISAAMVILMVVLVQVA